MHDDFRYMSSLKIKIVKTRSRKYANTAGSEHCSPKRCLITLKKSILRSQMWPVELMHLKYRHKGRKKLAPTSRLFYLPQSPLPKKDVPDRDPDSDYNLSLVTRKPVFGVCDKVRLKPACSATVTS